MVLSAGNTAQLVATYIGAIGTIGAVVLALFLNVIRERLRRPRLTVSKPSTEHGDLVWFEGEPLKPGSGRKDYYECYLRLRVHATAKRDTARSTRALLWKVERPERDPRLEVPDYLLKWSGPSFDEAVAIPPGMFRRLDLLRYRKDEDDMFLTPALLRDQNTGTGARPSARNRLNTGPHILKFIVSCDGGIGWELRFTHSPPDPEAITSAKQLADSIGNWHLTQVEPPAERA